MNGKNGYKGFLRTRYMHGMKGLIFLLFVVSIFSMPAEAKSLQDEIRAYLNKEEVASYQVVDFNNSRYIVVEVQGDPKLVFNVEAELVTDAKEIEEVLDAYYTQVEEGAFTTRAAEDMKEEFEDTFAAFQRCNATYYEFIETNYLWEGFRCVEPNVGRACDASTALRKALSRQFIQLKGSVDGLPNAMEKGATENTLNALRTMVRLSNETYENASAWDPYYKYFFGKRMVDDNECGLDPLRLKGMVDQIAPSIETRYVNQSTNASDLAQETVRRRDYSAIRGLQVRGEDAMDTARRSAAEVKSRFGGYGFPTETFDQELIQMERILLDLEAAQTPEEAEAHLNSLFSAVAEFNGLEAKYELLIPVYAELTENMRETDRLITDTKLGYDYDEGALAALEEDLNLLKDEIGLQNELVRDGGSLEIETLEELNAKAVVLKIRAGGEEESEPFWWMDAFPILAIFIVALGVALVYLFKIRRH